MKTELIKALKETVLDLKLDRRDYDWRDGAICNCGVLAQNICGMDRVTLNQNRNFGLWSSVCEFTGELVSVVMKKMFSVGLTKEDIIHLENLSDIKILNEANMPTDAMCYFGNRPINTFRTEKESLIKYMEAWVRILEREGVPEIAPINAAPNKPMQFISYEEMKTEMELLFQN